MENLQRQQAARLALEEKLSLAHTDVHSLVESHINRSVRAFQRYQSAVQDVLRAEVTNSLSGVPRSHPTTRGAHGEADAPSRPSPNAGRDGESAEQMKDEEDSEESRCRLRLPSAAGLRAPPQGSPMSVTCVSPAPQQHGWTYEEQFKQVRRPQENLPPAWKSVQVRQERSCRKGILLPFKLPKRACFLVQRLHKDLTQRKASFLRTDCEPADLSLTV